MTAMMGRWLCRRAHHKWNLAFKRVGEHQPCERGCGAKAMATENGWFIAHAGHWDHGRIPYGVRDQRGEGNLR